MPRGGARANSGGKRSGAGRKKGSPTKRTLKTNEIAEKAAGEGVLPLQVILEAMRSHYAAGDLDRAAAFAKDAAPYQHPRKNAVTVEGGERPISIDWDALLQPRQVPQGDPIEERIRQVEHEGNGEHPHDD